ncbi:MAG: hypothetical protein KJO35_08100, partial [Gammaproteobacteria bacterium]|nr:hypothetical protein [Gammaproteobacteria bacterium]
MQPLKTIFLSVLVIAGIVFTLPVSAASGDKMDAVGAKQIKVYRGAKSYGPFEATEINVDLRTLPKANQWQPGDPIKVIPKRYRRAIGVDHGADYNGGGPDALAEKQRRFTERQNKQAAQGTGATRSLSEPVLNFAGPGYNGVFPPDTMGEVGKDYYIHMINGGTTVTIYNKADGSQEAQFDLQTLAPQGEDCRAGLGDPVVLYDELAERWLLSEFSANDTDKMCVYVSQTSDPIAGGWFFYEIQAADFPDYPKYGVWPDAYYIGTNESTSRVYAMDRTAMLNGLT